MVYLFLSIFSSSLIFVTFKIAERYKANLVKLITINYLIASILGFSLNHYPVSFSIILHNKWIPFAILVGILFIVLFFLIGYSIRVSGVAATTIAGKMSMAIPILFSILYFSEKTTFLKITGLILAAIAVFLSIYRPLCQKKNLWPIFIPIVIFAGSGLTDSIIKYAQIHHIPNNLGLLFSSVVFLTSLFAGLVFLSLKQGSKAPVISLAELSCGTILGIANFGSLYFLIMTLNNSGFESSVIFGLNNMCIVLLSALIGNIGFKEKLSKINFAGILLALISIAILMNYK